MLVALRGDAVTSEPRDAVFGATSVRRSPGWWDR